MRAILWASGTLLLFAHASVSSTPDPVHGFLESCFKVTAAEIARVRAGQVVARTLAASDPREVATLGVVRMRVTPDFYVEQLADIVRFKRSESVQQVGRFSSPPEDGDVADLALDEFEVRKLRDCRVGDCGVQLSSEGIERFKKNVDWHRADAALQASRVMGRLLVEYVMRYRVTGAAASMEYADRSELVASGPEFASLVESDANTWQHFADLRRHLLEYPLAQGPHTTDILYWSKERTSRRSIVTVTHLAIARSLSGPADYVVASKQIYATHYFDASLGLTVLLRDRSSADPVMFVVYINRSRVDLFDGMFGGVARRIISSRVRSLVAEELGLVQRSMEQQFAAASR